MRGTAECCQHLLLQRDLVAVRIGLAGGGGCDRDLRRSRRYLRCRGADLRCRGVNLGYRGVNLGYRGVNLGYRPMSRRRLAA
jgi:hypothetical protein